MQRKQTGITLIGFVVVLAVVGFFAFIAMKLFPMYSEYYAVRQALKGLAQEPGIADQSPAKIQDLFFRRLYISYAENVQPDNVKLERLPKTGWHMTVKYELRKPLIGNLDVVGKFDAAQDLTRSDAGG